MTPVIINWKLIYRFPAPEGKKVLLKRYEKIYAGILVQTINGKQYFRLDGYGNSIPRVADYWAEIGQENYYHNE